VQVHLTDWAAQSGQNWVFSLDASVPSGATINPVTGLLTWTPSASGTYRITVRVSDPVDPQQHEAMSFTVSVAATLIVPVTPVTPPVTPRGDSTVGVFDPKTATWYLRDTNSPGAPSTAPFAFGAPGWVALVGDWDGDGIDTIGVVDPVGQYAQPPAT
jgi:hypothetical protein